jgi:hypothetical protein
MPAFTAIDERDERSGVEQQLTGHAGPV